MVLRFIYEPSVSMSLLHAHCAWTMTGQGCQLAGKAEGRKGLCADHDG